jgi:predicted RNase H-like nuclease (RuvC/YqgF family)
MKLRAHFLMLLVFPVMLHAQEQQRRFDVVILPQELNDQYQSLKNYLSGSDGQIRKLQETRDEIKRRYPQTHDALDLDVMLKELDRREQDLETHRKEWKDKIGGVEVKIKEVILSAHGRTVEWRAYNPYPVDKLGTVITTTYSLKDDQVVAEDVYEQLPVPGGH